MTSEDAFLAAIKAAPGDDLPRLVYADWLEEHAEGERAEFIRVQCRLAELEAGLDRGYGGRGVAGEGVNAIKALNRRERELLGDQNWYLWAGPAVSFAVVGGRMDQHVTFRRGFVESVTCPAAAWLAHGDAVLAAHPLRTVRLTDRPGWERHPTYGDSGYARLIGREKIESLGCIVESADDTPLIRKLLAAEWPGVTFELPPERSEFNRRMGDILARAVARSYGVR